jgi:hypothetical protein
VQVGQELQYEQGDDVVYWRITDVLSAGAFTAVPIHRAGFANEPRHFQLVMKQTRKNASAAETSSVPSHRPPSSRKGVDC